MHKHHYIDYHYFDPILYNKRYFHGGKLIELLAKYGDAYSLKN